jgi:2-C-methyl-D-erythritol 4-phosphate cytidylyltransferase
MVPWYAIIPAAGVGMRLGADVPKQFLMLGGMSILHRTVHALNGVDRIVQIVIAIDPGYKTMVPSSGRIRTVDGGSERQHSIANALETITEADAIVLVHDAVRPFADHALIRRVGEAAELHGAAIPVVPVTDTIKVVADDGNVARTLDRSTLRAAQTPQAFRVDLLRKAYAHARETGFAGTDDASLVEAHGVPVHTVDGDVRNLKITTQEDLRLAQQWTE